MRTPFSAIGLTLALTLTAGALAAQQPARQDTAHKAAAASTRQVPESLLAQAKISEDSARAIALHRVTGGTVGSVALRRVRGKLLWVFELKAHGKTRPTRVQVDAMEGKVVP